MKNFVCLCLHDIKFTACFTYESFNFQPHGAGKYTFDVGCHQNGDYVIESQVCTVEPPNKGHFGSRAFVLYLEAVLWWEVRITIVSTIIGVIASVLCMEVVLWWEGPL